MRIFRTISCARIYIPEQEMLFGTSIELASGDQVKSAGRDAHKVGSCQNTIA